MDEHLEDGVFRHLLGKLVKDLVYAGGHESDPDLFEEVFTAEFADECVRELEAVNATLCDEMEKLTSDDRRLVLCGLYCDRSEYSDDTPLNAAEKFDAVVKWLYGSHRHFFEVPGVFLARYVTESASSDFSEADSGGSRNVMDDRARTVVFKLLIKNAFSAGIAKAAFDRKLFVEALDALAKEGEDYAYELKTLFERLGHDTIRDAAAATLMLKVNNEFLENGDRPEVYRSVLLEVVHQMKLLNAMGSYWFWFE